MNKPLIRVNHNFIINPSEIAQASFVNDYHNGEVGRVNIKLLDESRHSTKDINGYLWAEICKHAGSGP